MVSAPLIIGHRGASAVTPENTLAAFSRALQDGADGIEFDVRLSRDRVPVIIHDASLKRTGQSARLVGDLTAAELQQCDVCSWFGPLQPEDAQFARTVPTLAQVSDLFKQNNALLYLEMKFDRGEVTELAENVVAGIHNARLANRVVVLSFDLSAITLIKKIDPAISTAALFEPRLWHPLSTIRRLKMVDVAVDHGADEIALHHTLVSSRIVEKANRSGLPVVVWTVDDVKWIGRARRFGIKALITNNPAKMIQQRDLVGDTHAANTAR
ncbi:MAG: glycerophosphodiester phosphodiesterase family protein [bacterium]